MILIFNNKYLSQSQKTKEKKSKGNIRGFNPSEGKATTKVIKKPRNIIYQVYNPIPPLLFDSPFECHCPHFQSMKDEN